MRKAAEQNLEWEYLMPNTSWYFQFKEIGRELFIHKLKVL